jgi:hypothetical protein
MTGRAYRLTLHPSVMRRSEGSPFLRAAGDAVLVERSSPRLFAMACPCGCREELTVNLDRRSGAAWRIYRRARGLTLFPSVHRTSGCESHFIIWDSFIDWVDGGNLPRVFTDADLALDDRTAERLRMDALLSFVEVADLLDEIPWAVLRACRRLVSAQRAIAGDGPLRSSFKLIPTTPAGRDD